MAKALDLTGQRFGRLVAAYSLGRHPKFTSAVWHCRCDCGGTVNTMTQNLRTGATMSCGCLRRECAVAKGKRRQRVKPGERFGWLVVLEQIDGGAGGAALYRCRCECGRVKLVEGGSLSKGRTTSCGCARSAKANHGGKLAGDRYRTLFLSDTYVRQLHGLNCGAWPELIGLCRLITERRKETKHDTRHQER